MPQMILSDMLFPNSTPLESIGAIPVQAGLPLSLAAEPIKGEPRKNSQPVTLETYEFLFWNIAGQIFHTPNAFLNMTPSTNFKASAWYLLAGGSGGKSSVPTFAFAADQDQVLPDNPIQSVESESATPWNGSSTVDNSTTSVTITAKDSVTGDTGVFDGWVESNPNGMVTGTKLQVGSGIFDLAIATYGADPCQAFRDAVTEAQGQVDACVADPGCPKGALVAFGKRLRFAEAQLQACEQEHGQA